MKQPKVRSISLLYLLIFICGIALIFWIFRTTPAAKPTEIPISQVVTMSQANQIKTLNVQGQWINITGTDGTRYTRAISDDVSAFMNQRFESHRCECYVFNPPALIG